MISSVDIENYRCFKNLHVEGLASANLIVGQNNSGKSSLLEALRLLVSGGGAVRDILLERGEIGENASNEDSKYLIAGINRLFYGCYELSAKKIKVSIKANTEFFLNLSAGFFELKSEDNLKFFHPLNLLLQSHDLKNVIPLKSIDDFNSALIFAPHKPNKNSKYVSPKGFLDENTGELWDKVTLTDDEKFIVEALQAIEPNIERIAMAESPVSLGKRRPIVKIKDINRPIPLQTMGDGMERVFNLILAMVNCKGGYFFVDEIENGLHHSAQVDLWTMILKLSKELNIQVFATTHSWDTVKAFQVAARKMETDDIALIRLEVSGEKSKAVAYTKDEIVTSVKRMVEVR